MIAALYGKLQSDPKISPSVMTNIHKLLHSAFEQAVLWECVTRNPFQKANVPKTFPSEIPMLSVDEIKTLIQNCETPMLSIAIHLAFAGSLRKGEILALTWDDVDFQKGTQKPVKRKQPDLVLRYSNGRPLSEETLPRLLEKQLLQLGLPVVSFHSLRHSSISYKLVLTSGNIKAVQGDSGHAQAEMITERYGHIIDTCRKQCAEDFEEEFYKGM